MSAPVAAAASQTLTAHARRLALPLVATSISIGASMFLGDVACQYIQFSAERTRLLEGHTAALRAEPSRDLPAPDIESLLAHRRAPDAPAPRVPSLPESWLSRAPSWWNPTRSMAMMATGTLAGGPWQFSIQRGAEALFPGRTTGAILRKMFINMSTAPIGISSTFFLTNYFQGGSAPVALARIRSDLPETFVTGFLYWPFVSFANLKLVDVAYRPVTGALAGTLWNIYISFQANSKIATPPQTSTTSTTTSTVMAAAATSHAPTPAASASTSASGSSSSRSAHPKPT